jgi:hypothetical protein
MRELREAWSAGSKRFLLFFKKEDSSFSEEKEAKRLLFLLRHPRNTRVSAVERRYQQ